MGNVHALIRGQRRSRGLENPIETSRLEVRRLDAANRIPELRPKARLRFQASGFSEIFETPPESRVIWHQSIDLIARLTGTFARKRAVAGLYWEGQRRSRGRSFDSASHLTRFPETSCASDGD